MDRQIIHDILYQELVQGILDPKSKEEYVRIINQTIEKGVTGVVLGCTEIRLHIQEWDVEMVVFDTTEIHVRAAVAYAFEK